MAGNLSCKFFTTKDISANFYRERCHRTFIQMCTVKICYHIIWAKVLGYSFSNILPITASTYHSSNTPLHIFAVVTITTISFFYVALPVRIIPPFGLGVPNFNIGEDGGSAEVCVQAVANVGVLERTVSVMLSTQDGTAVGKTHYYVGNISWASRINYHSSVLAKCMCL